MIAEFSCVLRNQRGKVVFTTNKSMLYDKTAPDASNSSGLPPLPSPSLSNEHLQKKKNKSSDGEITRVAPAGSYARSSAASSSSYSSHYDDESVGSPQVCAWVYMHGCVIEQARVGTYYMLHHCVSIHTWAGDFISYCLFLPPLFCSSAYTHS